MFQVLVYGYTTNPLEVKCRKQLRMGVQDHSHPGVVKYIEKAAVNLQRILTRKRRWHRFKTHHAQKL